MPFDVLPQHHITLPQVQFYHPPWQLAQMVIEARQKSYDAMLKGLDTVLGAVDPVKIAERRYHMMEMPLKFQELQYQTSIAKVKADWMEKHPGQPFPGSWRDIMDMQKYDNMVSDKTRADRFLKGDDGATPTDKTTPPFYKTVVPSQGALRPMKTPSGEDLGAPVPREPLTPPSDEDVKRFGPLPTGTTDTTNTAQPAPQSTPAPVVSTAIAQAEPLSGISSQDEEEEYT